VRWTIGKLRFTTIGIFVLRQTPKTAFARQDIADREGAQAWSGTMQFINALKRNETAATAIEYGLIAALIAIAAVTAFASVGNQLSTTLNEVSTTMGSV
jgi:pilus assembly protein Flp/PilA